MRHNMRVKAHRRTPGVDDYEAVKVVLEFIRTQSTIRFAALPFFLAALAVLTKTFYEPDLIDRRLIAAAALGLAVVALVIEIVLSRNLLAWWTAIGPALRRRASWRAVEAHRNPTALGWARWALIAPYIASLVFWLDRFLCLVFKAPAGTPRDVHEIALRLIAALAGVAACYLAAAAWRSARTSVAA